MTNSNPHSFRGGYAAVLADINAADAFRGLHYVFVANALLGRPRWLTELPFGNITPTTNTHSKPSDVAGAYRDAGRWTAAGLYRETTGHASIQS